MTATPLSAFLHAVTDLETAIDRIRKAAADHFSTHPDRITWSDVATARHYADEANLLADEITHQGEFAPTGD